MIATLTAFLQVFANMGLSWATVRSTDLNSDQVSTLFWVNLGVGFLAWGLMIAAGPHLAGFYNEPELALVAAVSGISFAIAGASVQPLALLTRAMNFKTIARMEVLALVSGAIVACCLALAGAGYWAIVLQTPVQTLTRLLLSVRPSGLRIHAPRWTPGLASMIGFGGLLVANNLLIFFARNLDSILIGRVWGAAELGFYSRAYFLMLLPSALATGTLSNVMITTLSSLQNSPVKLAEAYRRALMLSAYIGMPIAIGLALTAPAVIPIVYGPGWNEVIILLFWLSLAGITQPLYNTYGWLLTACGRGGVFLLVTAGTALILGLVFAMTVTHGPVSLARAYAFTMGMLLPLPTLWIAHHVASIPFWPSCKVLLPVILLNALMGGFVICVGLVMDVLGFSSQTAFPVQVAAGVLVYIALTPLLLPRNARQEISSMLNRIWRFRRSSA